MAFIHTGEEIPDAPDKDPDEKSWYGVVWDEFLTSTETISTSAWILPAGLTSNSELVDQVDTIGGTSYDHVNKILISGGREGVSYRVINEVTLSETSQTLRRSFMLTIAKQ